jgi:flagellar assembly protein FliH
MLSEELDQQTPGDGEELGGMMDDLTDFRRDVLDSEEDDDGKSG